MKKFVTLIFGLLIACVAVFAIPKELEKVPLNDLIKIEINHDATAPVVISDIQIDVDDGVMYRHMEINEVSTELETVKYIVLDEGIPLAGHRRWFSPKNQLSIDKPADDDSAARANKGELNTPPLFQNQTPIGLFDKNRCLESRLSMHTSSPPPIDSSGLIPLIE
jgi:hypothetical protein